MEGVMEKCGRATWVAGTFIAPKKMVEHAGFLTFKLLTRLSNKKTVICQRHKKSFHIAKDMSFFPSLIS